MKFWRSEMQNMRNSSHQRSLAPHQHLLLSKITHWRGQRSIYVEKAKQLTGYEQGGEQSNDPVTPV